jgi:hypothetical protein
MTASSDAGGLCHRMLPQVSLPEIDRLIIATLAALGKNDERKEAL